MKIRALSIADKPAWLALRRRLHPALSDQQHARDWNRIMEQRDRRATLLCVDEPGVLLGMIEVSRRAEAHELGAGPVAYLDGLHLEPAQAREATARRLAEAAASWAHARGCRVLAADTSLDNQWQQKLLLELGFEEFARKVVYRRALAAPTPVSPVASTSPGSQPLAQVHAGGVEESLGQDHGPGWRPGPARAVIIVLGILSFYFTSIFSGSLFFGFVLPVLDLLFLIYLLMLFVSMKYRHKTGAGERQLELPQVFNDSE